MVDKPFTMEEPCTSQRTRISTSERRRMDGMLEKVLKGTVRRKLLNKIDSKSILQHMPCVSSGTKQRIEQTQNNDGKKRAAGELLDEIIRFDDCAAQFLDALYFTGHQDMAFELFGGYIPPPDDDSHNNNPPGGNPPRGGPPEGDPPRGGPPEGDPPRGGPPEGYSPGGFPPNLPPPYAEISQENHSYQSSQETYPKAPPVSSQSDDPIVEDQQRAMEKYARRENFTSEIQQNIPSSNPETNSQSMRYNPALPSTCPLQEADTLPVDVQPPNDLTPTSIADQDPTFINTYSYNQTLLSQNNSISNSGKSAKTLSVTTTANRDVKAKGKSEKPADDGMSFFNTVSFSVNDDVPVNSPSTYGKEDLKVSRLTEAGTSNSTGKSGDHGVYIAPELVQKSSCYKGEESSTSDSDSSDRDETEPSHTHASNNSISSSLDSFKDGNDSMKEASDQAPTVPQSHKDTSTESGVENPLPPQVDPAKASSNHSNADEMQNAHPTTNTEGTGLSVVTADNKEDVVKSANIVRNDDKSRNSSGSSDDVALPTASQKGENAGSSEEITQQELQEPLQNEADGLSLLITSNASAERNETDCEDANAGVKASEKSPPLCSSSSSQEEESTDGETIEEDSTVQQTPGLLRRIWDGIGVLVAMDIDQG